MKKALITGANKSIGFETARQLLKLGYYVYLGSRSLENGRDAAERLKAEGLTEVFPVQLDVTDEASVADARAAIEKETASLDVLINNAGVSGGFPQTAMSTGISVFREVYETNVFGVIQVTQAFMSLLEKSDAPRIVNVTSGLGSLTMHKDPEWVYYKVKGAPYNSSKAALNMYTITLAYELQDTPFKVNVVDPGFTATDFNNHMGTGTVEDAAARLVKCALIEADGPTGTFFSDDNNPETGISLW